MTWCTWPMRRASFRAHRDRWLAVFVVAASVLPCARAAAFQNPARFLDEPAQKGGGGNRFFTGSPAEGYTCKVCHAPGAPVRVTVSGLPTDGYVPDQSYPITLDWPDDLKAVALNLEVTTAAGLVAGMLSVPPVRQLTAADVCSNGKLSGAGLLPIAGRSVVVVGECGQHQTTFVWKAPAVSMPSTGTGGDDTTLWFSASLVVSDGDGTVAGDRVTDIRRALVPLASAAPTRSGVTSSCTISPVRRSASGAVYGFAAAWLLIACRRRSSARRS